MFDQCLKILIIFGSFSAVARGEDYDEYTTKISTTSRPTSTSMTTTTQNIIVANLHECEIILGFCEWKNDPSANQSWYLRFAMEDEDFLSAPSEVPVMYRDVPSPRGNSSIRVISTILSRDDNYGCISISFKLQKKSKNGLVGLRGYQRPDYITLEDLMAYSDEAKKDYIIFEVWGDWGPYWYNKESTLKHFDTDFQIILEGIFGEDPMFIGISYIGILWRTQCTGNTAYYPIPNRQTTSTTKSTTTTMSITTTERPMRENGDTITDKVTKSDTWVDSPPASLQSNLWPTTTWPTTLPTTKQPTTTQTLQERNGCDSRNPPIILYLIAPGNSRIDFRVRPRCSAGAGTYGLNDLRANIVGSSSFLDHEKKPSAAQYWTENEDVVIDNINSNLNN